jgi:hypothetical protein
LVCREDFLGHDISKVELSRVYLIR